MTYPTEVIVLARLSQTMEAMCPATGETQVADREMGGLTKAMIVDYGDDWLDTQSADVPATWLLRVTQHAVLTSEQLPTIDDVLDRRIEGRWLPRWAALSGAKRQLRGFAKLKTWGGSR